MVNPEETSVWVDDGDGRSDTEEIRRDSVKTESDEEEKSDEDFITKIRNFNSWIKSTGYKIDPDHSDTKGETRRRLIKKNGKYNVKRHTESHLWEKYLRDLSNTLVASKWRRTILTATSSFILSWLVFAAVWMLIAHANGDLDVDSPSDIPCLIGINSFAGYFLFSLETQATIGYGSRAVTDNCPEALFVICLQIITSVAICGMTVNIVYIKMIKPTGTYCHKLFSKYAIICRQDGELCLIFRVRDEDQRHAIGTSITAYVLRKDQQTNEPYLENIALEPHGFLLWPLEIVHKIGPKSPFWDMSSYDLISDKFEIIVTLQGTSPTTGQCSKFRTSYVSTEILWGHRFKSCVKYFKKERHYFVQHKFFNATYEHPTHLCSAMRFNEVYASMSPTPSVSRNYNVRINVTYDGSARRGTLMSIESEGSSDRVKELKTVDEDILEKRSEASLMENQEDSCISKPYQVNIDAPSSTLYYPSAESFRENVKEEENIHDNYYNRRFPLGNLDDSWMKEAKSLPVITTDYFKYPSLDNSNNTNSKSYADYLTKRKRERLNSSINLSMLKSFPNQIFEEEEYLYPNASFNQSCRSIEVEPEIDMNLMLSSLEEYLQKNSSQESNSKLALFPETA